MPSGDLLIAYADAAHERPSLEVGDELRAALGDAAFVEAAATVAIFNGLVRTADASGIPLDDGTAAFSVTHRAELGIDDFAGAANTDTADLAAADFRGASVEALFANRFS